MIFKEQWWDGRREKLVEEMDKVWKKMKFDEQQDALDYASELYYKRIGNCNA